MSYVFVVFDSFVPFVYKKSPDWARVRADEEGRDRKGTPVQAFQ